MSSIGLNYYELLIYSICSDRDALFNSLSKKTHSFLQSKRSKKFLKFDSDFL
jgi:hypothetical protein